MDGPVKSGWLVKEAVSSKGFKKKRWIRLTPGGYLIWAKSEEESEFPETEKGRLGIHGQQGAPSVTIEGKTSIRICVGGDKLVLHSALKKEEAQVRDIEQWARAITAEVERHRTRREEDLNLREAAQIEQQPLAAVEEGEEEPSQEPRPAEPREKAAAAAQADEVIVEVRAALPQAGSEGRAHLRGLLAALRSARCCGRADGLRGGQAASMVRSRASSWAAALRRCRCTRRYCCPCCVSRTPRRY